MPRTADPTTRDRILDAAERLFYERGIRAVGVAELVAAAGTGKNVLYRHFPGGKDELVLAYLHRFAERLDAATSAHLEGLEGAAAVEATARLVADRVAAPSYRGCPFRNYLREMRDTRDRPGRFALAQVRALRSRLEEFVEPDVAERVWLVLEGVYAGAPYPERRAMAEAAVAQVHDLVA